jgi:hypothetical protein
MYWTVSIEGYIRVFDTAETMFLELILLGLLPDLCSNVDRSVYLALLKLAIPLGKRIVMSRVRASVTNNCGLLDLMVAFIGRYNIFTLKLQQFTHSTILYSTASLSSTAKVLSPAGFFCSQLCSARCLQFCSSVLKSSLQLWLRNSPLISVLRLSSHLRFRPSSDFCQSQSHIATDGQSVSQSVSLGVKSNLGLMIRYLLLFDSHGLVIVGRPLWREDVSAFSNLCVQFWPPS